MGVVEFSIAEPLRSAPDRAARTDLLFAYMQARGQGFYDESVTQLEHALQAAELARLDDADDALVTAALLHDFGHFLQEEHDAQSQFQHKDLVHETVAADFLEPFMPRSVTDPIRFHVLAKRYLCTTDGSYREQLSEASQRSFQLQGGKLDEPDLAAFDAHPQRTRILRVRHWDDQAKTAGKETPGLEAYRDSVTNSWGR